MDFHGSDLSFFSHRGTIGLSAQVEMAMPGDSLSISLAPGRALSGRRKLCCVSNIVQPGCHENWPNSSNRWGFLTLFCNFDMWKPSSSKICEHEFLRQLQNKEQIRKITKKKSRKEKTTPDSNPHSTFCFRWIQTFAANLLLFFSFFLMFFLVVFCGVFFEITTSLGIRFHKVRYIYLHMQKKQWLTHWYVDLHLCMAHWCKQSRSFFNQVSKSEPICRPQHREAHGFGGGVGNLSATAHNNGHTIVTFPFCAKPYHGNKMKPHEFQKDSVRQCKTVRHLCN